MGKQSAPRDAQSLQSISLVNGAFKSTISITDRAISYGDGLFETIALTDGAPHQWGRHYRRLQRGAERLWIDCPAETIWHRDLARIRERSPIPRRAILKLILSRGEGKRGYAPPSNHQPTRIVQITEWPEASARNNAGEFTIIECTMRVGLNVALAGIKHLNRLEQVLGAREVAIAGANEGIMFDLTDRAIAGTRSNLFVVHGDQIRTPLVSAAGVAGIMREIVLEEASIAGLNLKEVALGRAELTAAQEIFFTNSLWGVQSANKYFVNGAAKTLAVGIGAQLRDHLQQRNLIP